MIIDWESDLKLRENMTKVFTVNLLQMLNQKVTLQVSSLHGDKLSTEFNVNVLSSVIKTRSYYTLHQKQKQVWVWWKIRLIIYKITQIMDTADPQCTAPMKEKQEQLELWFNKQNCEAALETTRRNFQPWRDTSQFLWQQLFKCSGICLCSVWFPVNILVFLGLIILSLPALPVTVAARSPIIWNKQCVNRSNTSKFNIQEILRSPWESDGHFNSKHEVTN